MLQSFSDRIRNSRWLGYGIVIAISIPFLLWGIQSYLGGGNPNVAATVNGVSIKSFELQQQVSQRRALLRQRLGGTLPPSFSRDVLREQVLDSLITREVIRQAAVRADLRIGPERLAAHIRQQPFFQQNGAFNADLYRQRLRQAGLTAVQYEARTRQRLGMEQLRSAILSTAFALPNEARAAARLRREERQVAVLTYPREQAASEVSISTEAVRTYYQGHQEQFQTPPQRRIAYLELDMQALANKVDVTEEDIRAAYRENEQRYRQPDERHAAHLLVAVSDDATEAEIQAAKEEAARLRERLAAGADFEALAKEYSDDPGSADSGGDLGYIGRGTMMPPFEQALFGLDEVGAVSQPVRTSYGFHLIKLLDIRRGDQRSFAEARDAIEQRLRMRRAQQLFYDRVQVLQNAAYESPGSLQPAAEASGLSIQHSEWFSRSEGEGIARSDKLRAVAFENDLLARGINSKLIELDESRVAIIRVIEERPAEPKPLEAVRDAVRERVRQQRIEETLRDWSEQAIAKLKDGAEPKELAGNRADYRELGWIERNDGEIDPAIVSTAFEVPPPAGSTPTREAAALQSGGRAVVIVRGARLPEVDEEVIAQTQEQHRNASARAEMVAWVAALRAAAEIKRNEEAAAARP